MVPRSQESRPALFVRGFITVRHSALPLVDSAVVAALRLRFAGNRTSLYSQCVSDVTRIINAVEQGDPKAAEELLPLVYDELRRLAAQ